MKTSLLFLLLVHTALGSPVSPESKWHPGHYIYVDNRAVTPELLALPHFRGVQKNYNWRTLEPQEGHFDFSTLRTDLALAKKHGRQLVVQLTYKSFARGVRNVPDYLEGAKFGGGVYATIMGSYNPVLWDDAVRARFKALIAALGREFDAHPNLEAVNLPETAPSIKEGAKPQPGVTPYTENGYFAALKDTMLALRHAFPRTVVIQYTNFPPNLLDQFTDYEKEIGVGMGGPDVYPREDAISHPTKGVYRFYPKLAGIVPLGAAVQITNYCVALKKRNALAMGYTTINGRPIVITPEDEALIPVREHLQLAQGQLKLNYLFWSDKLPEAFENVQKLLAEPDLANDPAGGLATALPPKAFLR